MALLEAIIGGLVRLFASTVLYVLSPCRLLGCLVIPSIHMHSILLFVIGRAPGRRGQRLSAGILCGAVPRVAGLVRQTHQGVPLLRSAVLAVCLFLI